MREIITKNLLDIGAIFLRPDDPFIWASGIKSPIYCDNRVVLSYPDIRNKVEDELSNIVRKNYPSVDVIAGTSTAGIAHAAFVAQRLEKPMVYVRSSAKDHGRKNLIEGKIGPFQKVVVIEDLISTASSAIFVANVLREEGANVLGIASIFTYKMRSSLYNLHKENIKNISITNFDILLGIAIKNKVIKETDRQKLLMFRENPEDESWLLKNN